MEERKIASVEVAILYEDAECLFINKPAGLSVHSDGKISEYTLADWILEKYPALLSVGEPLSVSIGGESVFLPKPGIVHRLDKETSGVMLIAKTHEAYEFLKAHFQNRTIEKVYHAFVYGWIKEDKQTVSLDIARDSGNIRRWTTGRASRGPSREALTNIEVLKRFGNKEYTGKGSTDEGTYSFVEARPKTGRTHQIRVHLKAINHPIVSDSLYAQNREKALGFDRLALHARELTVTLPSGPKKTVTAPYPKDFEAALKNLD